MDGEAIGRAFELMDRYADHPMELGDASLIVGHRAHPIAVVPK